MSQRPTISAVLITLNEERNLPGLLARLDWVDEIVVVDGGSRDDTFRIARRHGCHVVTRCFDSFARQRNFALQLAAGQWILSIDADERPTPQLAEEIRRRIAQSRYSAFRLPIRSTIFGRPLRYCGTQDDCPIRLFRRAHAQWSGDVHEVLRVNGRIGRLRHWLQHTTLPHRAAFLAKMRHYTNLEAAARVAAGCRGAWWQRWLAPPREVFRRLIWKQGLLDGPAGWAFCLLSGYSEWVLAQKQRRWWHPPKTGGNPCATGSASVGCATGSASAAWRQTPAKPVAPASSRPCATGSASAAWRQTPATLWVPGTALAKPVAHGHAHTLGACTLHNADLTALPYQEGGIFQPVIYFPLSQPWPAAEEPAPQPDSHFPSFPLLPDSLALPCLPVPV